MRPSEVSVLAPIIIFRETLPHPVRPTHPDRVYNAWCSEPRMGRIERCVCKCRHRVKQINRIIDRFTHKVLRLSNLARLQA